MKDFGIVFEKDGITTTYWQMENNFKSFYWRDYTTEMRYEYFKRKYVPYYKERHEKQPWAYHRPVCVVVKR